MQSRGKPRLYNECFGISQVKLARGKVSYTQDAARIWTHGSEADAGSKGWYIISWVA